MKKQDPLEMPQLPACVEWDNNDIPQEFLDIPPKAQAILLLRAFGYKTREIADMFDMKQPSVMDYLKRYDPHKHFRLTPAARKKLMAAKWLALENRAIDNITPQKLKTTSAAQLATIAGISRDKQAKIEEEKPKEEIKDGLLQALEERLKPKSLPADTDSDR